jgi:agmatinase
MSHVSLTSAVKILEQGLPPHPDSGFLGVDLDPSEAKLVLIPVPWEATTSYGGGTSQGPAAMISASHQLDLGDQSLGQAFRAGIAVLEQPADLLALNETCKESAAVVIAAVELGQEAPKELAIVNSGSKQINEHVYRVAKEQLGAKKFVGLIGGDHACPQGLLQALSEHYQDGFGVLHFDAHHDLRNAYEGFTFSHASIFYNVMEQCKNITKLTQVAIRDYSRDERRYMDDLGSKGTTFYNRDIFRAKAVGESFDSITKRIIETLPQRVYVSFDIDALDPSYCPSTGTPVPGGLSFDEAVYILESLANSGRGVIGFDLCEVSPGETEWDANVGARMLYKLCATLLRSQRLC